MSGTSMAPYTLRGFASQAKLIDLPGGGSCEVQVMPDAFYKSMGTTKEKWVQDLHELAKLAASQGTQKQV